MVNNRCRYKTDIEKIMDTKLKEAGFIPGKDYINEYPVRCIYGYNLDFAFPKWKIDVECDGEHWHKKGNSHDRKRNHILMKKGWIILRFTNKQIEKDINGCIYKIKETIKKNK